MMPLWTQLRSIGPVLAVVAIVLGGAQPGTAAAVEPARVQVQRAHRIALGDKPARHRPLVAVLRRHADPMLDLPPHEIIRGSIRRVAGSGGRFERVALVARGDGDLVKLATVHRPVAVSYPQHDATMADSDALILTPCVSGTGLAAMRDPAELWQYGNPR